MKYGRPKFSLPLIDDWILVVTSTGNKFFHNFETKESRWNYPNKQVEEHVSREIDKNELLLLIAKARGLKIGSEEMETEKESEMIEEELEKPKETEEQQDDEPEEKSHGTGLVMGYDSSSDDDEERDEREEETAHSSDSSAVESMTDLPTDESEAEGGLNLSDLQSLESESGAEDDDKSGWDEFMAMLDLLKIDKYASWDLVVDKLVSHPAFYTITDNNSRKACFDHWSQLKGEQEEEEGTVGSLLDEDTELVKFVRYIQSRPKLFNYYAEFKRKHRTDPELKEITLADKERESYYKELVRFTKAENKVEALSDIVAGSSSIKRALQGKNVDLSNYDAIIGVPEIRKILDSIVSYVASDENTRREGLLRGLQTLN